MSEVTKFYPPLMLRVFVDAALLMGKSREVAEMAKKVMKKLKEEVDLKKASNCPSRKMGRKERAR